MNLLTEYLLHHYYEVRPIDFYRDIFPSGELQEKGIYEKGKYNAIAVEVTKEKKEKCLFHWGVPRKIYV